MTEWFVARLPAGAEDQGRRWHDIGEEIAALAEWLTQVSPAQCMRVAQAGMRYATRNGPFHAWLRFCEEALTGEIADAERSDLLWILVQVALSGGFPDRALAAAREKRELDLKRGAEFEAAIAAGFVADILQARGQLDEALKIRNEEQLPVYERLGDVREHAVTMHWISQIWQARGNLNESSRILREDVLPIYERLGDVQALLRGRWGLAGLLLKQEEQGDREEAHRLLQLALADARRLKLPEAQQIEQILAGARLGDDANPPPWDDP